MATKERVLNYLKQNKDSAVSGQQIADYLAVSRTSVWKAIKSLQSEGFRIEATTNKGYLLTNEPDVLSKTVLHSLLKEEPDFIEVHQQIGSTNDAAKTIVNERSINKGILLAEEQTKGRGRLGRQFYSPHQTGLYMSLIYKNKDQLNAASITTVVAVAVCKAIEKLTHKQPVIKWVNDIYLDGRKICGILTEGILNFETGTIDSIIVGIGINFKASKTVPEEFQSIIGSLFQEGTGTLTRNHLAAEIVNQLDEMYQNLDHVNYLDEYRKRCFVLGQTVSFTEKQTVLKGTARTIDEEGGLVVELADGQMKTLRYGEISIRLGGNEK